MTSLNSQQEKSIVALITALSQQDKALPAGLQKQLHAIGQNLAGRSVEIPAIAASLPQLSTAYQAALADPDSHPAATLVANNSDSDLMEKATRIFTAADSVQVAKKRTSPSLGQIASNPIKRLFNRG
ncbi:MAG: hypothetical protein ACFB2W_21640 [Leptolyngbyaceae cyanobacterium]